VSYLFPGFPQDPRLKIQVPFFTLNILSSEPLLKVKRPSPTNPYADAHLSPNGADDGRPTALQVIHDEGLVNKLVGKVMLVTGASSGIGIDTVAALHATGADIYMQIRDMKKGKEVMENILAYSEGTGNIDIIKMELDSFEPIRAGVEDFLKKSNKLNVLVKNAGKNCVQFFWEISMLGPHTDAAIQESGIPRRAQRATGSKHSSALTFYRTSYSSSSCALPFLPPVAPPSTHAS
jgi:short chain dehydrogenase